MARVLKQIHIVIIPYIIRVHNTDDQLNGSSYIKKDMKRQILKHSMQQQ